ncbi:MAG: peptide chain release factor N(5)-glutamine methyltransferase [Clostridiales bacterium]|nr:peptide chain release factor N(5)-glutamine methyltransferase [Clostridiales bacterium]
MGDLPGVKGTAGSLLYVEALQECVSALQEAGIADAAADAWLLLSAVTGMDRTHYYMYMRKAMPESQLETYRGLAGKRSRRIPLQYILGETEFMGLPFKVTPDVLIPRQDTEILVEEALKCIRSGMKVLDLCTGSGCIAVSLAKYSERSAGNEAGETDRYAAAYVPQTGWKCGESEVVEVTASDISEAAVAVARENAEINGVNVRFVQSDLFESIEGQFDVIVSNPPYIPQDVIAGLEPEVAVHEPHGALDGGEDGLDFYRRIIAEAGLHLVPGGWLLFEIGYDQGDAVARLLREAGYTDVCVRQDLAHLDRVVYGSRDLAHRGS